ncbi:nacht and wd domain-containing protein [Stemphylium lycopersici]|uniref:Nacht and wd domain-containing protein n=1 Tax=Stemphylium lycopersici TaxID=183478 RepID=A0A364MTX6_STELY|nr:nacht and wd domain-containing protein [Stemphylium lycopersici]
MLRAAGMSNTKPFLSDLEKNSLGLDIINDDFRHYADAVHIVSFYETIKLSLGIQSALIVERDSASIGLKHERIQPLNADHRTICKFDNTEDSNYVKVKNALASMVETILGDTLTRRGDEERSQISALQTYLDVMDKPIDELNNEQDSRTPGSCSWIETRNGFQSWLGTVTPSISVYWISAQPATGKTVLAGHIITQVQGLGLDCSYYFFKHGQKGRNTLSAMLRSIALQMAFMHPLIRRELADLRETSLAFDKDDEKVVWRRLFVGSIFKASIGRPQYWVIDAVDECIDPMKLFPLLSRIESNYPIQILMTSRGPWPDFDRQLNRLGSRAAADTIRVQDTIHDIRLFFEENMDQLPVDDELEKRHLVNKLVEKSGGCFLWARLVLQELQSVYSEEHVAEVIDEMPIEMGLLYERILGEMSKNVREKRLAKALLVWATCALRPLHSSELASAVKIDECISVRSLEKSVQGLCGQLLHVDKIGYVQIMHMTTRAFLTDGSLESEFAVSKEEGNRRIALACLKYLTGDEMRSPRNRTFVGLTLGGKSPIADYACISFSEHLALASSTDNGLFLALETFLRSNVLAWIEYIAITKKNLYHLTRTAKNLQRYLSRRAKHTPPLGEGYRYVNQWATDLVRLVAKFGRNILEFPGSVYYLVTPFCPRDSAVNQQFANSQSGLTVAGVNNGAWEDSISYIDFRENRAMSAAAGDNAFAIGTKSGKIYLYWQATCQERICLDHGESAKVLNFDNNHRIASSGPHMVRLWDLDTETLLWSYQTKDTPVLLQFAPDDSFLIVATRSSRVIVLSCEDGSTLQDQSFPNQQAPLDVAISPDCRMIAFAYRGKAVLIWSLDNNQLLGACGGEAGSSAMISNSSPQQVIFNSNAAIELMVVTFQNGNMTLYKTWSQEAVKSVQQDCHYMACSPDGRTLATGSSWGVLGLWDFETLTLLYQINTRETLGKDLSFTACGTRIIELRDRKTKIWEPAVLVRKTGEEDSSISESVTIPALMVGEGEEDLVPITSSAVHTSGEWVLIGKDDGTVSVYSNFSGQLQNVLYTHKQDIFVRRIAVSVGNVIASEDASNTVMAYKIKHGASGEWSTAHKLLSHRFEEPVHQILLDSTGDRLLISTPTRDYLFAQTEHNTFQQVQTLRTSSRNIWKWMSSIRVPGTVVLLVDQTIRRFSWPTLTELTTSSSPRTINIGPTTLSGSDLALKALATDPSGAHLIAEFAHRLGSKATERLAVWHATAIESQSDRGGASTEPMLVLSSHIIKHFLGIFEHTIVFLDHKLWVCSLDLEAVPRKTVDHGLNVQEMVKRHFFVPMEFLGGNEGNMGSVTAQGHVVFPKEGEVAVVRDGLKWSL